ncbi:MAG: kelch repeat-containing protein [Actinomycetota bacterium]
MRIVRRVLLGVGALFLVFVLLIGFLFFTTPEPRGPLEGWTRLADLPVGRGEVASAVAGDRLFVIGGLQGGFAGTTDRVDVYDASEDAWTEGPPLPEPRHHAAAAAIGDTIYVTGGSRKATDWTPQTNVWAWRADAFEWHVLDPLPEGRMAHQLLEVDGRLFAIGGRGGDDVLIFDPAEGWSRGAPIPEARDHLAALVEPPGPAEDGARIYAIGGRNEEVLSRVDVYDVGADVWSGGPELPIPMSAMAASSAGGRIHVVGGEDPSTFGGGVIQAHYVLNAGWEEAPLPIVAAHGSAWGVIEDRLVIAGGALRQGALSVLAWTGVTQRYDA